jgi:two-component system chemotaxis sensor kinase CheA
MATNEPQSTSGEKAQNPVFEDMDVIREFLIESNENLNRLDTEIVDLERNPTADRLASIFRTIHTIKGTCGFLGFGLLEGITHHAENILSQLRSGQKQVSGALVSLILETVDAVRRILASIESAGSEGEAEYGDLKRRLEVAAVGDSQAVSGTRESAVEAPRPAAVGALPKTEISTM